MPTARLVIIALTVVLVAAGCGSGRPHSRATPIRAQTAGPASTTAARSPAASSSTSPPASSQPGAAGVPRLDHIVVVILENSSYDQVVGRPEAPFLNSLERTGAVFTQSYAVAHPSQPNYLALFSGSTQGITDDSCPHTFRAPNLGRSLIDAGHTFAGYSEDLPSTGYTGCSAGGYARKHNPWADFANVPASANRAMTAFPADPSALPTVAFVVPNLEHDLHDGTLAQADQWLSEHLGSYAAWAGSHNSLLVVTNDEDDFTPVNRIATLIVGAHVVAGRYAQRIDHYALLHTIEDAYGLSPLGASARSPAVTAIWSR